MFAYVGIKQKIVKLAQAYAIGEWDSRHGFSLGFLGEFTIAFTDISVGGEVAYNFKDKKVHGSVLGLPSLATPGAKPSGLAASLAGLIDSEGNIGVVAGGAVGGGGAFAQFTGCPGN